MIERRRLPALDRMAVCACLRKTRVRWIFCILKIGLMTSKAVFGQSGIRAVRVAAFAVRNGMPARERKSRQVVIELRRLPTQHRVADQTVRVKIIRHVIWRNRSLEIVFMAIVTL